METTEKYINNIFERQSETEIKDLLYNLCNENGGNIHEIDEAINKAQEFKTIDFWGCDRYNRAGIKIMLNHLI